MGERKTSVLRNNSLQPGCSCLMNLIFFFFLSWVQPAGKGSQDPQTDSSISLLPGHIPSALSSGSPECSSRALNVCGVPAAPCFYHDHPMIGFYPVQSHGTQPTTRLGLLISQEQKEPGHLSGACKMEIRSQSHPLCKLERYANEMEDEMQLV